MGASEELRALHNLFAQPDSEGKVYRRRGSVSTPPWAQVATRRVIAPFLQTLARSHGWDKVYIVSPWISELPGKTLMTLSQMSHRLRADKAVAYVVTRPPLEDWHESALYTLASSGQARIVLLPSLHTKLFCAKTAQQDFAMLGSANLTAKSLINREIAIHLHGRGDGKALVRSLILEAADIYRSDGRKFWQP